MWAAREARACIIHVRSDMDNAVDGVAERNKNAARDGAALLGKVLSMGSSAFGELEALAGAGATGLFAFLHPRVPGEEAGRLEFRAHFLVQGAEGA